MKTSPIKEVFPWIGRLLTGSHSINGKTAHTWEDVPGMGSLPIDVKTSNIQEAFPCMPTHSFQCTHTVQRSCMNCEATEMNTAMNCQATDFEKQPNAIAMNCQACFRTRYRTWTVASEIVQQPKAIAMNGPATEVHNCNECEATESNCNAWSSNRGPAI